MLYPLHISYFYLSSNILYIVSFEIYTKHHTSIDQSNLCPIYDKLEPRDMLISPRERLAPTEVVRERTLIAKYCKLQKVTDDTGIDKWLRDQQTIFTQCKIANIPDVQGTRAVIDFLVAVAKIDSNFADIQLDEIDELESKGRNTESLLSTIFSTLMNTGDNFAAPRKRLPGKRLPRSNNELTTRKTRQRDDGTPKPRTITLNQIARYRTRKPPKPNCGKSQTATVVTNITTASVLTLTNSLERLTGNRITLSRKISAT
jgi:hypothetical protein